MSGEPTPTNQPIPIFVQACKEKPYGQNIWVNLNNISSFEKNLKVVPNEQWFLIKANDGCTYYTTYNLSNLSIYTTQSY